MKDLAKRQLARWEALPPRTQFFGSYAVSFVVLLAAHIAFALTYHRITVLRGISYAVFEALVVAGLVTLATQGELIRRREAELAREPVVAATDGDEDPLA
jgi:hypothetical protein